MANGYVHKTPEGPYELSDHELPHFFDLVEGGYLGPGSMLLVYTTDGDPHMAPTHASANVVGATRRLLSLDDDMGPVVRACGLVEGPPEEGDIEVDARIGDGWYLPGPVEMVGVFDEVVAHGLPIGVGDQLVHVDGRPLIVTDDAGDPQTIGDIDGTPLAIRLDRNGDLPFLSIVTADASQIEWASLSPCDPSHSIDGTYVWQDTPLRRCALATLERAGLAHGYGCEPDLGAAQVSYGRPVTPR